MSKVLIISFYYPPKPAVGGLRTRGLVKYLPQFGWEPILLTDTTVPKGTLVHRLLKINPNQNLLSQAQELRSKLFNLPIEPLLKLYAEIFAYPDACKWWTTIAVGEGVNLVAEYQPDVILSTSSPVTCHIVASILNKAFDIPWVADFRDLWTQNHYYPYSYVRRGFEEVLERRTMSKAKLLTTVSEPLAKNLSLFHSKPVCPILNGYDPDELNNGAPLTDKETLTHTGNIYPDKQDVEGLFQLLSGNVVVRFYGPKQSFIDRLAGEYGIKAEQYGVVGRKEALQRQRESHKLVYFCWNGGEGIYSQKLFEYVAAKRPIMVVGDPDKYVSEVLEDARKGDIERYSQVRMAEEFANMLGSVL